MSLNLNKIGFRSVVNSYDLFFIDIWGVIHNGLNLHDDAIEVLNFLDQMKKKYVLLTNAPRPNNTVRNFLKKLGLDQDKCNKVYTSGEASLTYLSSNFNNSKFYHIGPPRDFDLFNLFKKNKVNEIKNSDFILCTGFFENYENDLDYYKSLLKENNKKKMICTNPDLVVDRGESREFCAGTIAKIFEELNGQVEYFGKPFPLVYKQSTNIKDKKILCIGDNLNTDIRGAYNQKFSSLFILNGVHKDEIAKDKLSNILQKYKVNATYVQDNLKW